MRSADRGVHAADPSGKLTCRCGMVPTGRLWPRLPHLLLLSRPPEETEEHARVLLPRSTAPEIALSSAPEPERATLLEDSDTPASQHDVSPLRGVRYSALTGPGPSGMRPEHAREMLSIRRRPLVGRAWRALSRFQELARLGQLPQSARWVLRTRLVFLEKIAPLHVPYV